MLTQCVRAFHNDLLRDPFERPLALVPKQVGPPRPMHSQYLAGSAWTVVCTRLLNREVAE
jgi:hypothetical protein